MRRCPEAPTRSVAIQLDEVFAIVQTIHARSISFRPNETVPFPTQDTRFQKQPSRRRTKPGFRQHEPGLPPLHPGAIERLRAKVASLRERLGSDQNDARLKEKGEIPPGICRLEFLLHVFIAGQLV